MRLDTDAMGEGLSVRHVLAMWQRLRGVKRAANLDVTELPLFRKQLQVMKCGTAIQPSPKEKAMDFASLCLFLGVLFAFATLILKVVEVARDKK